MAGLFCGSSHSHSKKKKHGFMQSIYTAFFGTDHHHHHHHSKHPKSPAETTPATPATVSRIVSSIRPLHIADSSAVQSPRAPSIAPSSPALSVGSAGTKTSYASADFGDRIFELDEDVKKMEEGEAKAENDVVEEEEKEEVVGGRAEQIIGRFYQQIRMQALNSIGATRA